MTKAEKMLAEFPDTDVSNVLQYEKILMATKGPNYKAIARYHIIPDLNVESIDEVRSYFIKPTVESKHKLKKHFIEFRVTWENILFETLNMFWNLHPGSWKFDAGLKLEYYQTVYLAQRDYLTVIISDAINTYDNTINKEERKKLEFEIKILSFCYFDINQLVNNQFRSNYLLLGNKREIEKQIEAINNKFSKQATLENRSKKRNTLKFYQLFTEYKYAMESKKITYLNDTEIINLIRARFYDKQDFKEDQKRISEGKKTLFPTMTSFNKWKNKPTNKTKHNKIKLALTNERIKILKEEKAKYDMDHSVMY